MKSILDPSFRYTTSVQTDLRKTFARVRRELREQQQAALAASADPIRSYSAHRVNGARERCEVLQLRVETK